MTAYLEALESELGMIDLEPGTTLDTVYLGGGTPSLVPPPDLAHLLDTIGRRYPLRPGAEVTAEANPEDVTPELIDTWVRAGVTRISLGVQSFRDSELVALDRRHDARTAREAARTILERSEIQLNVDLMLGIPDQDAASLRYSVERTLEMGPAHVSVYILEMDKPHRLQAIRRRFPGRFAGEDETTAMYLEVHESLTAHGYEHYEVSNFARPGARARHNLAYWNCEPVHALGAGAHGAEGARRWANLENVPAYLEAVAGGTRPLAWSTVLSPRECLAEELLMGLRLRKGVPTEKVERARRTFPEFSERLDEFLELELAVRASGGYRLTPRGWLLSNELFVTLV